MTLPCSICFDEHRETATLRCRCGGMVDCAGSEGSTVRRDGHLVVFTVCCVDCSALMIVGADYGAPHMMVKGQRNPHESAAPDVPDSAPSDLPPA